MIATSLLCLALNMHFEAGNQPEKGRVAVAHVTLNRARLKHKPVCEVVASPRQFSWVGVKMQRKRLQNGSFTLKIPKNGLPRGKKWSKTLILAKKLLKNEQIYAKIDPKMAQITHFHATYVSPVWSKRLVFVEKIGDHLFYLERRRT